MRERLYYTILYLDTPRAFYCIYLAAKNYKLAILFSDEEIPHQDIKQEYIAPNTADVSKPVENDDPEKDEELCLRESLVQEDSNDSRFTNHYIYSLIIKKEKGLNH